MIIPVKLFSLKPKDLNISTDLLIYTEFIGGTKMATITLSLPKEFELVKKRFPEVNWNEILKQGILRRLAELKKFEELRKRGYELRNIIIWDRTNLVNGIGIFGWPSNYITMGVTFEYLLDFWRPPK